MIDDALREELSALLDDALPEGRARELRRRIEAEPELRREYEALERASAAVRALPREAAPPELRTGVHAALAPRRRGQIYRLGGLAAAAAVLLGVLLTFYKGDRTARHEDAKQPEMERTRRDVPAVEAPAETAPPEVLTLKEEESGKAKAKETARDRVGRQAPKDRAEADKKLQAGLLATVARTRSIPHESRKTYLKQLRDAGAEAFKEHVRAAVPDQGFAEAKADTRVLASILLEDREEADLVREILGAPPEGDADEPSVRVAGEPEDRILAGASGTPAELAEIGRWLALLDLTSEEKADAKGTPGARVAEESRVADDSMAQASRAQDTTVRTSLVQLRFKPAEKGK